MVNLRQLIDTLLDRRLPKLPPSTLSEDEKMDLCRRHGDFSLAYSTAVQPGLQYFGDDRGYIAYATKMGHTFVLGDPVAPRAERADYIRRFVAASSRPCFVQIGKDTAGVLSNLGYRVNHMGIDTHIPLETNTFSGKRNETVRYSERWLLKKNYTLLECDGTVTDRDQLRQISESWRRGKIVHKREMRFLNRPFAADLSAHMRRFVIIDPMSKPVALLDFDPIFADGHVVGYTSVFKRKLEGTTPHAEIGLTKFAADRFREEGRTLVTLGLSPLAAIAESGFTESRIWRAFFERAYRSPRINTKIFNLQGQAAFKRRFHGDELATYIAFKRGSAAEMIALLRLLKTL